MKHTLTLLTCLLIGTSFGFAQDGTLDPTFGNGGIVTTAIGPDFDEGNGIAIQKDGKILVAGTSTDVFSIVRYNIDGSLDSLFGVNGKKTISIGVKGSKGNCIAIQSDGKIVIAGTSNSNINFFGNNYDFATVRLNANGSIDESFGIHGKVVTAISGLDGEDVINGIVIQGDKKIIVAGYATNGSIHFAVARYDTNGVIDNTFGYQGVKTIAIGSGPDYGNCVTMQPDGKIIIAGYSTINNNNDVSVIRLSSNGELDTTFNSNGKIITEIGSSHDYGYSIALQQNGKIIVVGSSVNNDGNNDIMLVRYNNNGSLDNSFNSDGKVTTAIGLSEEYAQSVAIQSDGKIVVSGFYTNSNNNAMVAVLRYNTNGDLDSLFGLNGKITTPIGLSSRGTSLIIQPDEKIVVAGYSSIEGSYSDFALIRYNNPSLSQPLPVELTSFSASSTSNNIQLNWKTVTESNNVGWEIESKALRQAQGDKTENKWKKIGFVAGKGTTTEEQTYEFQVASSKFQATSLQIRLKQIDLDGKFAYSNELSVNLIPETYSLSQNYPNPFNPKTTISYALPKSGKVVLRIYDVLGKEIAVLQNGFKESGRYSINFDGSSLSSGMYFYKLETDEFSQVKKLQLIK